MMGKKLSDIEIKVLKLLCQEMSSKQIASELFMSKYTVDNHRKHMLQKTGAQNSVGLVLWAIKNGYHTCELKQAA